MRKLFLIFAIVLLFKPVMAKEIAGVSIDDKITTAEGVELLLNGAGIRKKVFFKIYIAGLYLQSPQQDAADAIADDGPKRVVMHFLYDKVGKEKLVEGWNDGFSSNNDSDSLKALQPRIDAFNAMFEEDMLEGDVVVFDYLPGAGTSVNIKGKLKGVVEGKDFNDALLSIWLGKEPISSDLRKALLKN